MKELIGEKITKVFIDEENLTFETASGKVINYAVRGDCCSKSVWYDFYGLEGLLKGGVVIEANDINLYENEGIKNFVTERLSRVDVKNYDLSIEIYGVAIVYDGGNYGERSAAVSFRNYSNGYYGGRYYQTNSCRSNIQVVSDVYQTTEPLKID